MAELEGPGCGIPGLQPLPSTGWLSGRHPGERKGVALRGHPAFCCPHPALLGGLTQELWSSVAAVSCFLVRTRQSPFSCWTHRCTISGCSESSVHVSLRSGSGARPSGVCLGLERLHRGGRRPCFPRSSLCSQPPPMGVRSQVHGECKCCPSGVRGVPCGSAYASLTTGGGGGSSPSTCVLAAGASSAEVL